MTPPLRARDVLSRARETIEPPIFARGRDALFAVARTRPPGRVVAPVFICDEAVQPFRAAGHEVLSYHLDRQLSPDLEEVRRLASGGAAFLLAVQYFGVPQDLRPLEEIARGASALLVEDCAHGLPTGKLGAQGDVSVFSLRKMLPTPGAAFVRARPGLDGWPPPGTVTPDLASAVKAHVALGARSALQRLSLRPPRLARGRHARRGASGPPQDGRLGTGAAGASISIAARCDWAEAAEVRRKNYSRLLGWAARTSGVEPVLPRLTGDSVPYGFPVLVRDRERFVAHASRRGVLVEPTYHESVGRMRPEARHGRDSIELATRLVTLPVHQGLAAADVDRVSRVAEAALS